MIKSIIEEKMKRMFLTKLGPHLIYNKQLHRYAVILSKLNGFIQIRIANSPDEFIYEIEGEFNELDYSEVNPEEILWKEWEMTSDSKTLEMAVRGTKWQSFVFIEKESKEFIERWLAE